MIVNINKKAVHRIALKIWFNSFYQVTLNDLTTVWQVLITYQFRDSLYGHARTAWRRK